MTPALPTPHRHNVQASPYVGVSSVGAVRTICADATRVPTGPAIHPSVGVGGKPGLNRKVSGSLKKGGARASAASSPDTATESPRSAATYTPPRDLMARAFALENVMPALSLYLRPTAETRIVIEVEQRLAWSAPTAENARRAAESMINDFPRDLERRATVEQDYEWTDGTATYASLFEALTDNCDDEDADWPHYGIRYKSSERDEFYTVRSYLTFPQLAEHAFRYPWDFSVTFARPALTPGELRFIEHAKACGFATHAPANSAAVAK